jgi:O-antigen/teichoic acid export membrane protein
MTIRGSAWTLVGDVAGHLLRLGGNLILTRLLFPSVFGQMALVQTFLVGLVMFSDIGTGPAIVQSPHGDDPRFLNTLWSMQCVRGLLLWLGTGLIAIPAARFYEQPLLAWLIPAAGFSSVLAGLESTSLQTLKRHLRLGKLTAVELASQAVGLASVLLLVLVGRQILEPGDGRAAWALVLGNLVGSATRLLLSHLALPGIRHRFFFAPEHLRQQLAFGRWVFLSTALAFLAGQLDRLIFGKAITIDLLGVYGIAAMAASIPSEAALKLGGAVVFPAFSRVASRPDFSRVFWRVRLLFLLGGALLVSGLIASGPHLIRVLYDDRYAQAGWILRYLAMMAWFQILAATNEAAMLALGRPHWLAAGNGAKAGLLMLLVPLGFHQAGFAGALVGLVCAEFGRYAVSGVAAARRGLRVARWDVIMTALICAVAAGGELAGGAFAGVAHPDLAGFLAAGTLVVALWALLALATWRFGSGAQILSLLRHG